MKKRILLLFPLVIPFLNACNKTHYYTIKFVNFDDTLLETKVVKEGDIPTYTSAAPTRDKTIEITYKFNGWDSSLVPANKNTTYKAVYREVENYDVIFLGDEKKKLKEKILIEKLSMLDIAIKE